MQRRTAALEQQRGASLSGTLACSVSRWQHLSSVRLGPPRPAGPIPDIGSPPANRKLDELGSDPEPCQRASKPQPACSRRSAAASASASALEPPQPSRLTDRRRRGPAGARAEGRRPRGAASPGPTLAPLPALAGALGCPCEPLAALDRPGLPLRPAELARPSGSQRNPTCNRCIYFIPQDPPHPPLSLVSPNFLARLLRRSVFFFSIYHTIRLSRDGPSKVPLHQLCAIAIILSSPPTRPLSSLQHGPGRLPLS